MPWHRRNPRAKGRLGKSWRLFTAVLGQGLPRNSPALLLFACRGIDGGR